MSKKREILNLAPEKILLFMSSKVLSKNQVYVPSDSDSLKAVRSAVYIHLIFVKSVIRHKDFFRAPDKNFYVFYTMHLNHKYISNFILLYCQITFLPFSKLLTRCRVIHTQEAATFVFLSMPYKKLRNKKCMPECEHLCFDTWHTFL